MPKIPGIRKRGTRWEARYRKNGREKVLTGFRSQRAAAEALAEYKRHISRGATMDRMEVTLLDYLDDFIATFKSSDLAAVTNAYFPTARKHLEKFFPEDQKLATITFSQFQQFINAFADGSLDGHAPRSYATVSKLISHVSSMCKIAITDQILYVNFADGCTNPGYKPSREALSHKTLQVEDAKRLIAHLQEYADLDHIEYYELITEALTGTRCSETLALTWPDIDFEHSQITINKSWDYARSHDFKATKNDSSNRTIPMSVGLAAILKRLKSEQSTAYLASGYRDPDQMLFRNIRHHIPSNKNLNDALRSVESELNISHPITTHGLRHTLISYLLGSRVSPLEVAKISGHANLKILFDTYAHLQDQADDVESIKARKLVDDL
ncbi:site-specific integrase [Lacticaseibacillus jixiensis]|uniref:site-specific integrase n=1 Tax=Lacticaseibacillus jixiensis TaxID=3231926 RepID=UPI0036F251DC